MIVNLAELAERAATSTEAQARAKFAQNVIEFPDYERRTMSRCLPKGKTVEDAMKIAKHWREKIWAKRCDEDRKIEQLLDVCTALMGGNLVAGQLLASATIWEPS